VQDTFTRCYSPAQTATFPWAISHVSNGGNIEAIDVEMAASER
jgi:hypothetical protein